MKAKPRQRNYTRELKNALAAGAVIECAVAPYEGYAAVYRPETTHDPKPWVLFHRIDLRYSGRECRVRREES